MTEFTELLRAIEGVRVTFAAPRFESVDDIEIEFDKDTESDVSISLWRHKSSANSLVMILNRSEELDDADVLMLVESIANGNYRIDQKRRVYIYKDHDWIRII